MTEINAVEADLTRHKLVTTEDGEIVRAHGHIVVFDNIGKYIAKCRERKLRGRLDPVVKSLLFLIIFLFNR